MPRSTITSKGQVTIPKELRERFGLEVGDVLEFVEDGQGGIHVRVLHDEGALGVLRHRADRKPVSVEAMRAAIRRRARGKVRTRP